MPYSGSVLAPLGTTSRRTRRQRGALKFAVDEPLPNASSSPHACESGALLVAWPPPPKDSTEVEAATCPACVRQSRSQRGRTHSARVRFRRAQPDWRPGDAGRGQAARANSTDAVAGHRRDRIGVIRAATRRRPATPRVGSADPGGLRPKNPHASTVCTSGTNIVWHISTAVVVSRACDRGARRGKNQSAASRLHGSIPSGGDVP